MMGAIGKYIEKERENRLRIEALQRIRIQDYGDDIAFTIDGIKAASISGDVKQDIETLNRMRNDFIKRRAL